MGEEKLAISSVFSPFPQICSLFALPIIRKNQAGFYELLLCVSFLGPPLLDLHLLVFGRVHLDSTSGQSNASGQSPSFVAGQISGRHKPSAPSWGLVAPPPWQQPFFPPEICASLPPSHCVRYRFLSC